MGDVTLILGDDESQPSDFGGEIPQFYAAKVLRRYVARAHGLPEVFLHTLTHTHREEDVVRYSFGRGEMEGIRSFWRLTFFERCSLLGVVLESPIQQE